MELTRLLANRIIPVVVLDDARAASPVAQALVRGGLTIAEVTLRTEAGLAGIAAMAKVPGMCVGAGTVLSTQHVDAAVAAGAGFVVSPGLCQAVVEHCAEHAITCLPGISSPTELMAAVAMGVKVVKFFPADLNGGPLGVTTLASVFPQVGFVPTGGVGPHNLDEYLAIPQVRAVGGSWLVHPGLIATGAHDRITELTREAMRLVGR